MPQDEPSNDSNTTVQVMQQTLTGVTGLVDVVKDLKHGGPGSATGGADITKLYAIRF